MRRRGRWMTWRERWRRARCRRTMRRAAARLNLMGWPACSRWWSPPVRSLVDVDENGTKSYTGRLEYRGSGLTFGAHVGAHDYPNDSTGTDEYAVAFGADVDWGQYEQPGAHIKAGVVYAVMVEIYAVLGWLISTLATGALIAAAGNAAGA